MKVEVLAVVNPRFVPKPRSRQTIALQRDILLETADNKATNHPVSLYNPTADATWPPEDGEWYELQRERGRQYFSPLIEDRVYIRSYPLSIGGEIRRDTVKRNWLVNVDRMLRRSVSPVVKTKTTPIIPGAILGLGKAGQGDIPEPITDGIYVSTLVRAAVGGSKLIEDTPSLIGGSRR